MAAFFARTGQTYSNNGIGGETSTQISARAVAASGTRGWLWIYCMGRNDVSAFNANGQAAIDVCRANIDRSINRTGGHYLVSGITKGEVDNGTSFGLIDLANSQILNDHRERFIDITRYMNEAAAPDGVAPDPVNYASGAAPRSFYFESFPLGLHFKDNGYQYWTDKETARIAKIYKDLPSGLVYRQGSLT
jgi:hypothetical protein